MTARPYIVGSVSSDGVPMDSPRGIGVSPDGSFVYVSGRYSSSLAVIDAGLSSSIVPQFGWEHSW